MNQPEDHPLYHGPEVKKLEFKFYVAWNSHSSPSRPSHGPVINLILDDVGSSLGIVLALLLHSVFHIFFSLFMIQLDDSVHYGYDDIMLFWSEISINFHLGSCTRRASRRCCLRDCLFQLHEPLLQTKELRDSLNGFVKSSR